MKQLFSLNGRWYRLFDTIGDLLMLNIMFVIGSLPVVTVVTSLSALYDGVSQLDEHGATVRRFLRAYRRSLKFGIVVELAVALMLAIISSLCWLLSRWGLIGQCITLLLLVGVAMILLATPYVAYLMSNWNSGFRDLLMTAVGSSMANMIRSIVIVLLGLMLLAIPIFAWRLFALWFFIGFAVCAWVQCKLLRKAVYSDTMSTMQHTTSTTMMRS